MGVSTQSAMGLMAHALDLRHRFPLLCAKVEALEVAPYKTRQVAEATRSLPYEAARWVDEELAARVNGFGVPTIQRLVALAAARFAPEEQAEKEQTAGSGHHVTLSHPRPGDFAGTSWLEAAGDTKDLTAFHRLVCEVAKQLGRLGETDDFETRKARALGVIAGGQGALDLLYGSADAATLPRPSVQTNLYVHVSLADLAVGASGEQVTGEVEKLGPATMDLIRTWLQDSKARILPVLDLDRTDAVDQHDPPPWMRELVILRDRHCVFPWCGRDARARTSTTSSPTSRPTRVDRPARPTQRISHHCVGDITARRPSPAGPTNAPATAPTNGPAPTGTPGPSDPTAPAPRPRPHPTPRTGPRRTRSPPDADARRAPSGAPVSARASPALGWQSGLMADGPAPPPPESGEHLLELRKEAFTMALYVAICLLAALIALPERAVEHTSVLGVIWGIMLGLAIAHWFAFRVSARLVGAGAVRQSDVESAVPSCSARRAWRSWPRSACCCCPPPWSSSSSSSSWPPSSRSSASPWHVAAVRAPSRLWSTR